MTTPTVVAIGDIHGDLAKLTSVLQSDAYQNADIRIFLGDIVDGTTQGSLPCLDIVMGEVANRPNTYYVRGNHEDALALYLSRLLNHATNPSEYSKPLVRKYQQATLNELHSWATGEMTLPITGTATDLVNRFLRFYDAAPQFVRVGMTYFAHGGWSAGMLKAEQPYSSRCLGTGVYTADLSHDQRKAAMLGYALRQSPDKVLEGIHRPPPGRHLVVGHHWDNIPVVKDVTCIDGGAGKSASGTLLMAAVEPDSGNMHIHQF